ncbi:hypothetical protein [Bacillus sp. EAC]|uniref:hypothetical protein n=1 Tax=Bacillus sp. EAC TaxID=1978338 RepID=UPI000B453134|nr:hypothetical protein [Bacillus sp. EAC]
MKKLYIFLFISLLLLAIIPGMSPIKAAATNMELYFGGNTTKQAVNQIPKLTDIVQVSTNQLLITYDQQVDINSATKPSNYWIQSMTDLRPTGIATLGKRGKINSQNSLTNDEVKIAKVQGDNNSFLLTFNQNIPSKKKYRMIVCYVTTPGGAPYNGDNGMVEFTTK